VSTLAVVIPTRNMAATLGRAIGSACHGGADEVVVVDDASEDDTPAVVEACQREFPVVRYVRHAEKTPDHNVAQRDVWLSLTSDQVVGMGADDYLLPGAITALKAHAYAPVVFADADTIDPAGTFMYHHTSDFYGDRRPEEVRARFQSPGNVIESGCGSALRMDMVRWLWDAGWDKLGPIMDSVGYATVACLFGATYLNCRTVAITVCETSYGHPSRWTPQQLMLLAESAVRLMRTAGLDEPTVRAICRKRCYCEIT